MASKKKDGDTVERAQKSLLQRATAIVKILESCTPDERNRVMMAVGALTEAPQIHPLTSVFPNADD